MTLFGILLVVFGILAGWMFIAARMHFIVRILASAVAVVLAFWLWHASSGIQGYAVSGAPPAGIVVYYAVLDPAHGHIYIWAGSPPRAFQIPYSRKLAERMLTAIQTSETLHAPMRWGTQGFIVVQSLPPKGRTGENVSR